VHFRGVSAIITVQLLIAESKEMQFSLAADRRRRSCRESGERKFSALATTDFKLASLTLVREFIREFRPARDKRGEF